MNVIELKHAVKEYAAGDITVRALDHINLEVKQGIRSIRASGRG